jgi:tetratricopeptide (TPR) repeat protein
MKKQGDVQGIINALTHLNVLQPSKARQDTLAYLYVNERKYMQALNTIGFEVVAEDSDLAVEVKAVSLKALNQLPRAIAQYELLFKRKPNEYIAYELADLKLQTNDNSGATANIEYGLANVTEEAKFAFYEAQQPYEASLKAAFTHLKGLVAIRSNQKNIDEALKYINEALAIDPAFNLARISRDALENRKKQEKAAVKN